MTRPTVPPHPPATPSPEDEPVLPRSPDESAEGWGEGRGGDRDAEWYERERPPHHGG